MKKIKKKHKIFKLLLLLIIISSIFFVTTSKDKNFLNEVIPSSIKGTIINKDNTSFVLMTENDSMYTFKESILYNIGDDIKITYLGSIDITKSIQDINIKNISNTEIELKYSESILNTLNDMTIEDKIGQLLLARVPEENKLEDIITYHLGGYLLFKRDVIDKSYDELQEYIQSFQDTSDIPMIIAIDEEGGTVTRLSSNTDIVKEKFKSPQELYNEGGYDLIKEDTITKNKLLKDLGINFNLAPVADICTNEEAYIYKRSFGKDKEETSKFIKTVVSEQTTEVSNTLKHFPGYSDNLDTHTGMSTDTRTYTELKENDFVPFRAGVDSGVKGILVSHNIMESIDNNPASISTPIHNMIRTDLNFKGLIFTDDLSMEGMLEYNSNPYTNAVLSGNNMLIVTDYENAFKEIKESVNNGTISNELLDRLVLKVLQIKEEKNLI